MTEILPIAKSLKVFTNWPNIRSSNGKAVPEAAIHIVPMVYSTVPVRSAYRNIRFQQLVKTCQKASFYIQNRQPILEFSLLRLLCQDLVSFHCPTSYRISILRAKLHRELSDVATIL